MTAWQICGEGCDGWPGSRIARSWHDSELCWTLFGDSNLAIVWLSRWIWHCHLVWALMVGYRRFFGLNDPNEPFNGWKDVRLLKLEAESSQTTFEWLNVFRWVFKKSWTRNRKHLKRFLSVIAAKPFVELQKWFEIESESNRTQTRFSWKNRIEIQTICNTSESETKFESTYRNFH